MPTLLCLHGWGGSKESFTELREALKDTDIEILTPDLPGFGGESEPDHPFTVEDYGRWVVQWLQQQSTIDSRQLTSDSQKSIVKSQLYLLGHSHGGRIAIKMVTSGMIQPKHLFLCAAAGIKRPRHLKRMIGLTLAKTGKIFLSIPGINKLEPLGKKLLYKLVRVHDYEKASPLMRQTMINVTREDLRPSLKEIAVPTDIFWGKDDGMTPYADALIMDEEIPESTLHSFEGVRHRVHRDRANEIATVISARMGRP